MLRLTLIELASFLLPFIIFFVWRWQSAAQRPLSATPTLKLAAAGAALAVAMLILMVVLESIGSGHEGDQYVPPQVIDGRVVPGHFIPADEVEGDEERDERADRQASDPQ